MMDTTMQLELFQVYDRPAIYRRQDDSETCIAWNRQLGRFEEDVEALHLILTGSSEVRRIDRDTARLLIARLLAHGEGGDGEERGRLVELQEMEAEAARKRVPLSDADKARRASIVSGVLEGALAEIAFDALSVEEKSLIR
jgi:hypothetical protein